MEPHGELLKMALALRPITEQDETFLYRVYASTRAEELLHLNWDEAQKESFLRIQFTAQHTYYLQQFPRASFQIILVNGEPEDASMWTGTLRRFA